MSSTCKELHRKALDAGFTVIRESKNRTVYAKGLLQFSIPTGHTHNFNTRIAKSIITTIRKGGAL